MKVRKKKNKQYNAKQFDSTLLFKILTRVHNSNLSFDFLIYHA